MIKKFSFLIILVIFLTRCTGQNLAPASPHKIDFNWQFHLGDLENGENPALNTSSWRILDLPHDWSIEGKYSEDNGTDWQTGYLPAGIGWYRKTINWDPAWEGKLIKILFEGIYLNSDVWINSHHLGHRPNGYISFEYDLTKHLKKGENIIAVRVDHSKPLTSRWYTGSGIYRHVWLVVKNPVNIANWGVFFSTPEVSNAESKYKAEVTVSNQKQENEIVQVKAELFDKSGNEVSAVKNNLKILAGKTGGIQLSGILQHPKLWSPDHPNLYTLRTSVIQHGKLVDEVEQKVGFRKLEFSSEFGFKLNGEVVKFKGVSDHHTAGPVGAAVPDNILLSRLRLLKKMGCNAIRTTHNPFSPAFYNICDSLGLMVLNEFLDGWDQVKAPDDYGLYFNKWWKEDGSDFIKRDRNHPAVVIWSIGNEVAQPTREVQKQLVNLFHQYDPTRPVTQGGFDPTRGMTGTQLSSLLDIKGFNGDGEEKGVLENFHVKEPKIPMICTEVPHTYQTRGVYRTKTQWRRRDFPAPWETGTWDGTLRGWGNRIFPIPDLTDVEVFPKEISTTYYQDGQVIPINIIYKYQPYLYYQSSYDNASVRSSARKAWQRTRDLDYVMGQFRWGSFDYLGETNRWPSRLSNFGVIDICGFPKDHFYLYQSMWTVAPMVHILPHWTHSGKEGVKIPVVAYTNCDEVELFLNGKSLGQQKYNDEQLVWMVPYTPGTLKAIAKKAGKIVAEDSQTTSGEPAKIRLTPNRTEVLANRTDVVQVSVDITDKDGIFCPNAATVVGFDVSGPAKIIGVDNGDPLDLSKYKTNVRRTFRGKAMLLLQTTDTGGTISITAKSGKLKDAEIEIQSNCHNN